MNFSTRSRSRLSGTSAPAASAESRQKSQPSTINHQPFFAGRTGLAQWIRLRGGSSGNPQVARCALLSLAIAGVLSIAMPCGMGQTVPQAIYHNRDSCNSPLRERWAALAMEESGDCDGCIGPAGELSRYQITPANWLAAAHTGESPTNQWQALAVAMRIQSWRVASFARAHGRMPTNLEWVLLWKCPGRAEHPSAGKLEQAQRVVNLIGEVKG